MSLYSFPPRKNGTASAEKQRKKSVGSLFASLKKSILPSTPRSLSKPLELPIDTEFADVKLQMGHLDTCSSECKSKTSQQPARLSSPVPARRIPRKDFQVHDLLPGKLGIAFHPTDEFTCAEIKRRRDLYFFSTDLHERYMPFGEDFGPVTLGTIFAFWEYVWNKEHHPLMRGRPLIYYTDTNPKNQANAAVLLGAYTMLEHQMSADETAKALEKLPQSSLIPFQDIFNTTNFAITVRDCLEALEKADECDWLHKNNLDAQMLLELEDPHNGDLSLIGDKFVAFRGPNTNEEADWSFAPSHYELLFKHFGVTCVVRLNEASSYDKEEFERQGLVVHDLEFEDCSCPSPAQIERFLDTCDRAEGRVAVHCKAGLGRTGTMIGLWMMKHLGFSARQAIAWLRLSRPGSVIGRQQNFLALCEHAAWHGNLIQLRLLASKHLAKRRSQDSKLGLSVSFAVSDEVGPSLSREKLGKKVDEASRKRAALCMNDHAAGLKGLGLSSSKGVGAKPVLTKTPTKTTVDGICLI